MTREEKLYSMTGNTLLGVAEKLGLNVNKNILKQGKSKLIEKILEAEAEQTPEVIEEAPKTTKDFLQAVSDVLDGKKAVKKPQELTEEPIEEPNEVKTKETTEKAIKAPKRANLKLTELTYKGETKSIKEWAAEINMPWPTLYDRVNRNGWLIDEAIETPLGQRRKKA